MSKPLVSDEFWELVQPLLPPQPPKPKGGRPRIPDRQVLSGQILFAASKTGEQAQSHTLCLPAPEEDACEACLACP